MNDLDHNSQNRHEDAVKDWWNSEQTKEKWHGKTYEDSFDTHLHYWVRQQKTLDFLDSLNLPRDAKILELGFGGAETAKKILDRGYVYYGLDISKHLCDHANKIYEKYVHEKRAHFHESSLEKKYDFEDNFFDLVIICGAIHYAGNLTSTFSEVGRVLKTNGRFIIGQGNMYTLNDMINFRKFLKGIIWYFTKENFQYSYSLSYRDMLLETKLKKHFEKYKDRKFMNSNFMKKNSNIWKYKIDKRLFSYGKLKLLIKQKNFKYIAVKGGPFLYSSKENTNIFKKIANKFLQFLLDKKILRFLINFADNIVIMCEVKK